MVGQPMLVELPAEQDLDRAHRPNLSEPHLFLRNSRSEGILGM
jgi:hypothetical protein